MGFMNKAATPQPYKSSNPHKPLVENELEWTPTKGDWQEYEEFLEDEEMRPIAEAEKATTNA